MADLVTGEAVVLDLRLAKLASRALAFFIDFTLQVSVLFSGVLVTAQVPGVDDALAAATALVVFVMVIVGYPVTMETLTRGRTLGKLALGLRVVRDDGGPIRFRHAFVRGLLGLVELWITWFTVALITSLVSSRGKRLGDLLAGTVVVRERVPVQGAPVVAMPPTLAGWAAGLDLTRVPDDLALAARQFLMRSRELSPEVQARMGNRLADALAAVTSPPPPPGVPAWAFLAAVVAERRRREMSRLQPADPRAEAARAAQPQPLRGETPRTYDVAPRPESSSAPRGTSESSPFTPPG